MQRSISTFTSVKDLNIKHTVYICSNELSLQTQRKCTWSLGQLLVDVLVCWSDLFTGMSHHEEELVEPARSPALTESESNPLTVPVLCLVLTEYTSRNEAWFIDSSWNVPRTDAPPIITHVGYMLPGWTFTFLTYLMENSYMYYYYYYYYKSKHEM